MPVDFGLLDTPQSQPIPLRQATPQPVNYANDVEQGYTMAGDRIKTDEATQQYNDQQQGSQILQQYLQQGGDIHTPQGIQKALVDLKGKVPIGYYENLVTAGEKMQQVEINFKQALQKMDTGQLTNLAKATEASIPALNTLQTAYQATLQSKGEAAANAEFQQSKQELIAQIQQPGNPLNTPGFVQQVANATPQTLPGIINASQWHKQQVDNQLKEAQTAKNQADATFMSSGMKGAGTARLYVDPSGNKYQVRPGAPTMHVERMDGTSADVPVGELPQDVRPMGSQDTSITSVVPVADQNKHGEEYLATLPTDIAAEVRAIGEGRAPMNSLGYRGMSRQQMFAMVNQAYPDYQGNTYNTRAAVRKSFSSGADAKNIVAINTALGHTGTVFDLAQQLGSTDIRVVNSAVNKIKDTFGNPNVNNMQLATQAVGDELMRVFRQSGASKEEADAWQARLNANSSPAQVQGFAKVVGTLLNSRIAAVNNEWRRGMGTTKGYPNLLDPHSLAVLKKLGIEPEGDPDQVPGAASAAKATPVAGAAQYVGNPKAEAIKQQFLAGKITREQAVAQIKALGQ